MAVYSQPRILLCGDTGISVEFGNSIDRACNEKVQRLFKALKERYCPGILDLIPAYRSLCIHYDPWSCSYEKLLLVVEDCLCLTAETGSSVAEVIEIPVCYGGEYGPDLTELAAQHQLGIEEVITLHSREVYDVVMIGFTPGFAYLGGLDERLFTPRKKQPRKSVPAGSVGIADQQTGIYSIESPGGWQLIGRTPVKLFDPERTDPFLLKPGNRLRFRPITRDEFESD
jgi:KipI family sensor histidine kinase inhibitor